MFSCFYTSFFFSSKGLEFEGWQTDMNQLKKIKEYVKERVRVREKERGERERKRKGGMLNI